MTHIEKITWEIEEMKIEPMKMVDKIVWLVSFTSEII